MTETTASLMTAATVMDVPARSYDCDGQQLMQSLYSIGQRSQIARNSKVEMARRMDTFFTTQMVVLLSDPLTRLLWDGNSRRDLKQYKIGMSVCSSKTSNSSYKKSLERTRIWPRRN